MPESICDVGCGSGGVLAELRQKYSLAQLYGYEIAPDVVRFWPKHEQENINFCLGNLKELTHTTNNIEIYDVILVLDVIEHVADSFFFLNDLLDKTKYFVFHIPLDLSAINVLREKPILDARKNMAYSLFYEKFSIALVEECGFEVIEWRYSGVAFDGPRSCFKTKLVNIPRRILCAINKDLGVRILGGETLFILAQKVAK